MKIWRWRSSTVEQLICNQQAAGSIPIASSAANHGARERPRAVPDGAHHQRKEEPLWGTCPESFENLAERSAFQPGATLDATSFGGVPERSKGTDCKSVATGFEGSNPSPSTITSCA